MTRPRLSVPARSPVVPEGYNPKLGQKVVTTRRRIKVDRKLPMGEAYATLIRQILPQTGDPTHKGKT